MCLVGDEKLGVPSPRWVSGLLAYLEQGEPGVAQVAKRGNPAIVQELPAPICQKPKMVCCTLKKRRGCYS